MRGASSMSEMMDLKEAIESLRQGQARILGLLLGQHDTTKEWFTPTEFGEAIGRSPYTVRSWIKQGCLTGRKREVGRGSRFEWEIHRSELEKYLNHGRNKQVNELVQFDSVESNERYHNEMAR